MQPAYDVIAAGGETAGVTAAIQTGRDGPGTLLVNIFPGKISSHQSCLKNTE
jgi:tRNA U34 5-carboxymethylaminomethyl modifying enzyme MnmG/GidA